MTGRFFFFLPVLAGIAWGVGGCSSIEPSPLQSYDSTKPQTFLPGAEVEQAKSLAMGSAVTKGWRVVESSGNRLVVERPLDAAAAQSVTGEPVSTAAVEVKSQFFNRQGGVDVVVDASLLADKGSDTQRKIDFTERYRNDLNQSLNRLRQSWEQNRWRVGSAAPPLPAKVADVQEEGASSGATTAVTSERAPEPVSESTPAYGTRTAPPPTPTAAPVLVATPVAGERAAEPGSGSTAGFETPAAPPPTPSAAPALITTTTIATTGGAPIEDRTVGTPHHPVATGSAPAARQNEMLILNRQIEPGVWGYYAEHYAKIRGCQLSGDGAVLEKKLPEYEIHRVYCENEKSFLVKCSAGTCRGLE